jgi:hypothetical protein
MAKPTKKSDDTPYTKVDDLTFAHWVYKEALGEQIQVKCYAFLVTNLLRWYAALVQHLKLEGVKLQQAKLKPDRSPSIQGIKENICKIEKRMAELKPRVVEYQEEKKKIADGHIALKYKALLLEAQAVIPWEDETMGWHTRVSALLAQPIPGEAPSTPTEDLSNLF